jgi:LPS sulfotransferase NodH
MGVSPVAALLRERGVALPEAPQDLSPSLRKLALRRSYVIVMTGRTGSTWLAGALEQIEDGGKPKEYFSEAALPWYARMEPGMKFDDVVVDIVSRHRQGGTFGFKINPTRLFWLGEIMDLRATLGGLGTRWIDMRRWNLVRQAHSFLRAKASGVWHRCADAPQTAAPRAAIADRSVWQEIAGILQQERRVDAFYLASGFAPLRIYYEEIADSRDQLLVRVGRHIGLDLSLARAAALADKTRKLASGEDEAAEDAFVERHAEALNEIAALRQAPGADQRLHDLLAETAARASAEPAVAVTVAAPPATATATATAAPAPAASPTADGAITRFAAEGRCPICEREVRFLATSDKPMPAQLHGRWFRNELRCSHCKSPPRERAIAQVLEEARPGWRGLAIHESSPGGWAFSAKLRRECAGYVPTQFDPSFPFGQMHPSGRWRNETLEAQTFADESFDIVIAQDVFEHLFDPARAAAEIARTLRPGGLCLMTVPVVRRHEPSQRRAALVAGELRHLLPEQYHGNPVGDGRSLVTVDWGYDIGPYLSAASGLNFALLVLDDMRIGVRDWANVVLAGAKSPLPDLAGPAPPGP